MEEWLGEGEGLKEGDGCEGGYGLEAGHGFGRTGGDGLGNWVGLGRAVALVGCRGGDGREMSWGREKGWREVGWEGEGFGGVRWVRGGDVFAPNAPNSILAGASPQTPLRKLTSLPQTLSCIKGPTSKCREGKGGGMEMKEQQILLEISKCRYISE